MTKYGPLRWAGADDIPALFALEYALFDNNMTERTLKTELEAGEGIVYDVMGEICGYALIREDGDKLDLTRLGVRPESQGGGIGSVLLSQVLSMGKPVVLTVKKTNVRALKLYLRAGFTITGHLTEYEAWSMQREATALAECLELS
jgi:ribosomal-protein-alanine N-acetyltransferase